MGAPICCQCSGTHAGEHLTASDRVLALLLVSAAQSRQRLRHMQRFLCFGDRAKRWGELRQAGSAIPPGASGASLLLRARSWHTHKLPDRSAAPVKLGVTRGPCCWTPGAKRHCMHRLQSNGWVQGLS